MRLSISAQDALPSISAVYPHRGALLIRGVFLDLLKQRKPLLPVISRACRQRADLAQWFAKLGCCRGHDLGTIPRNPHQLLADQNISLDIGEAAQSSSFDSRPDLVSNMRPHVRDARRIDADQPRIAQRNVLPVVALLA